MLYTIKYIMNMLQPLCTEITHAYIMLLWCDAGRGHSIPPVRFLQKMHALHRIVRSYQTNPNWWTVCKLTDQQFLESVKIMKNKERLRNYHRSEMTRETWQLKWNVISWILDHKKDLRGENWWNPNKSWSALLQYPANGFPAFPPAAL